MKNKQNFSIKRYVQGIHNLTRMWGYYDKEKDNSKRTDQLIDAFVDHPINVVYKWVRTKIKNIRKQPNQLEQSI